MQSILIHNALELGLTSTCTVLHAPAAPPTQSGRSGMLIARTCERCGADERCGFSFSLACPRGRVHIQRAYPLGQFLRSPRLSKLLRSPRLRRDCGHRLHDLHL